MHMGVIAFGSMSKTPSDSILYKFDLLLAVREDSPLGERPLEDFLLEDGLLDGSLTLFESNSEGLCNSEELCHVRYVTYDARNRSTCRFQMISDILNIDIVSLTNQLLR